MPLKRNIIIFLFFIFNSLSAYASQDVKEYVDSVMQETMSIIKDQSFQQKDKSIKLRLLLERNFDLNSMVSSILGRNKVKLSSVQIEEFNKVCENYILTYCSKMLANYNAIAINIRTVSASGSLGYIVRTEIIQQNNQVLKIDFLVKKLDQEYKIVNIIIEGISLITTHAIEITNVIRDKGFNYLINNLKDKSS
ncbi:toluene tolerance, Ttg2 family protein [Orientia chuto str. Dubai]|uniref:Toluene tolerance, Ttg2 family protein n=1 Tax=Orientia chuto str. Dubai TaxID=1359168 RepID=A0A0F3MQK9_9RICK|nr:ABC transporter substrate-binding protein [Candidatus Orientia mediorientalis]KJV56889.1 toluene tolerance, Ttg2 family protein [Orientia chuto str. Dubai]